MLRFVAIFFLVVLFVASPTTSVVAKQNTIDSIESILPNLRGEERLDAIRELMQLTTRTPLGHHYLRLYLEEGRLQKCVTAELYALTTFASYYNLRLDCDSVFIFTEEAIRVARQHKRYNPLFFVHQQLIDRYLRQNRVIMAIRKAEEAYQEAKTVQDNEAMAEILAAIARIYRNMHQFEQAKHYILQSVEAANINRSRRSLLFIRNYYDLCDLSRLLSQPHNILRFADSMRIEIDRIAQNHPDFDVTLYNYLELYHRAIAYAELNMPERSLQTIQKAEVLFDPNWHNPWFSVQLDDM